MKKFKERRRCERYKMLNSPSVMIYPERVLSYNVLDVSHTGLAFSYIGWDELPIEEIKIDFFDLDRELFFENIQAKVISDILLKEKQKNLRRCSVEFSFGDNDQKENWRRYIERVATN